MPGTLYVVATPIGNLEDLTFRARRILGEVELIAAEDTRRTAKLLAHYQVRRPLVSLREHNEARESARLVNLLHQGKSVALVSDAGTPAIADPGARFVQAARTAGVPVVPVPGPSAVAAAISVSGFPSSEFVFMGFPPRSGAERTRWFERASEDPRPIVFFEAPHRIRRTVAEGAATWGVRQILVIREMTKVHESYVIHPNSSSIPEIASTRGEFTVVLGPVLADERPVPDQAALASSFARLTHMAQFDDIEAVKMVAALHGLSEHLTRKLIKKARISARQRGRSLP